MAISGQARVRQQVLQGGAELAYRGTLRDADLAQLVEHLICNQGVAGSIPAAGRSVANIKLCISIKSMQLTDSIDF